MRGLMLVALMTGGCGELQLNVPGAQGGGGSDTGATGGEDGGGDEGGGDEGGGTDEEPDCALVYFDFTGAAVTVSGSPFGGAVPRGTGAVGSLGYKPCLGDRDDSEDYGEYRHVGTSEFSLTLGLLEVTGSGSATIEVVVPGSTWRFVDGKEFITDEAPRKMRVDGVESEELSLWISTGPDDSEAFSSDEIPEPDWLDPEAPHTFSLEDEGGTALIQWDVFELRE